MAISKERLDELIKEDATIYALKVNSVGRDHKINYKTRKVKLDSTNEYFIENNVLKARVPNKPQFRPIIIGNMPRLYEFEKDARWEAKYQHKTRTEELNLPTWEEFKNYNENECVAFVGEDWETYELSHSYDEIVLCRDRAIHLRWDLTEKDYIRACDLCLELFEGDGDD